MKTKFYIKDIPHLDSIENIPTPDINTSSYKTIDISKYTDKVSLTNKETINYIDEDIFFIPENKLFQFGEFLLGGLSWFWPILYKKYDHIKFCIRKPDNVHSFVYDCLKMLNIPSDRLIFFDKPTTFKNIHTYNKCFYFRGPFGFSKDFAKLCQKMSSNVNGYTYDKIYLSRAKMGNRKVFGEELIQRIFEKNGYHVIYPETLSFTDQVSYMKNCKSLAGCAGSALHLSLFMPSGGEVIQLKRNAGDLGNEQGQVCVNTVNNLDFIFIDCAGIAEPSPHWEKNAKPQYINVTSFLKQFFDDRKFSYTDKDIEPDKSAYNEYLQSLKLYKKHVFIQNMKKPLIRILQSVVPIKTYRRKFNKILKKLLRYEF